MLSLIGQFIENLYLMCLIGFILRIELLTFPGARVDPSFPSLAGICVILTNLAPPMFFLEYSKFPCYLMGSPRGSESSKSA